MGPFESFWGSKTGVSAASVPASHPRCLQGDPAAIWGSFRGIGHADGQLGSG